MSTRYLVDTELLWLIDAFPPVDMTDATLPDIRRVIADLAPPEESYARPDVHVSRREVAGGTGDPDVPVIAYRPSHHGVLPAIIHVHGGGYVSGTAAIAGPWCVQMAADLGCMVVSVDYRLAPETIAPGAVRDCYAVLRWLNQEADRLSIDPRRIAIAGESAGGGLAAATAIYTRDQGEYTLCHQSLMYPMLDDQTVKASPVNPYVGEFIWTRSNNAYGWRSYLGVEPGHPDVPAYGSPGREPSLAGLPPAYIAVGALDLFLEENIEYGRRLLLAGVPVELSVVSGAIHGFDFDEQSSSSLSVRERRKQCIARSFDGDGDASHAGRDG